MRSDVRRVLVFLHRETMPSLLAFRLMSAAVSVHLNLSSGIQNVLASVLETITLIGAKTLGLASVALNIYVLLCEDGGCSGIFSSLDELCKEVDILIAPHSRFARHNPKAVLYWEQWEIDSNVLNSWDYAYVSSKVDRGSLKGHPPTDEFTDMNLVNTVYETEE
jgi:hypothetical protein